MLSARLKNRAFQMNEMNSSLLSAEDRDVEVPSTCRKCEARRLGVCAAMTPSQLRELNRFTTRRELHPGAEIQGQGESISTYANVIRGVVKLTKVMEDGRQQIVGLQFAPDFIGRPFLEVSGVTAEAATALEICSMSKAVLDRLVNANAKLEHRILRQTLVELDDAREWMLTLGRKTAREKVASFLYMLASHAETGEGLCAEFEIPLKRQDIGDFLGLTIETVSRQITSLRHDKIIEVFDNRQVIVPVLRKLAAAAKIDAASA
jgi:CRP/FNR family transcriptional regulator